MMSRTQITLDDETHRRARKRAAELGVSFAEYIRSLVARDLASPRKRSDPSILFALGRSIGSDVAENKDTMIAEAFSAPRSVSLRSSRTRRR
jgi:plasmid stability protein